MSISARLRKVGGSVMVAVPPSFLEALALKADHQVDLSIVDGSLVVSPVLRPVYTLNDLIAACEPEPDADPSEEDLIWARQSPIGQELI